MKILQLFCLIGIAACRKHHLSIKDDNREEIGLTTFGFLVDGELSINITKFNYLPEDGKTTLDPVQNDTFGFTLDKTPSSGISPNMEGVTTCALTRREDRANKKDHTISIIYFRLDLVSDPPGFWIDRKGKDVEHLKITTRAPKSPSSDVTTKTSDDDVEQDQEPVKDDTKTETPQEPVENQGEKNKGENQDITRRRKRSPEETGAEDNGNKQETPVPASTPKANETPKDSAKPEKTPPKDESGKSVSDVAEKNKADGKKEEEMEPVSQFIPVVINQKDHTFSAYFVVHIRKEKEEGLYNFQFHNCANMRNKKNRKHAIVNYTMLIDEKNGDNYLSAGEIPYPALFFVLCLVYFALSWIWFIILRRATEGVFKTHYLMLSFLIVKGLSLFFHAIDYHFIQVNGHHGEAFAILYYITYLMKGTLLVVTILLVGAGWSFIKHLLSTREKKLFIVIIPLQILANVAQVIIQETEESTSQYTTWKMIFLMLDLLCCGAILFPVVWSIRHLQEASQTDGKAAINLAKLKIFRHFYILIVCYIYSTRIITYLLAITLPFQYAWMCMVFKEGANLVFFVMTGYKFRPASDNPYLQLPQSDSEEEEIEEVLTQGGAVEGLTRVNIRDPVRDPKVMASTALTTPKMRESSHEYD